MRTKIISIVLSLTILLSCFCIVTPIAASATSGKTGDCIWNFDEATGVLTIEGNGEMRSYRRGGENLPWEMKKVKKIIIGKGVTYIGANAFNASAFYDDYKSALTSVKLPSTLKKIGKCAFYGNKKLKKITLPQKLKVLGGYCFYDTGLTSVKFPKSVREICGGAFSYTKLKSVRIPSTVKSVGDGAFGTCSKLKKVAICNGVKKLHAGAFEYCNKLKKIKIPATTKISGSSLDGFYTNAKISVSKKNKYLSSKSGMLFNKKKTKLIRYYINLKRKSYKIPKTVKYICKNAFGGAKKLKRVFIGNKVKKIGSGAFVGCPKLKSVSMGDNVTRLGSYAFSTCKRLEKVKLSKKIKTIKVGTFINCKRLKSIKLPPKLKVVEDYSFANCRNLKKVTFPPSLKRIDTRAFMYCASLTEVKFPKGITSIPDYAFSGCKKIEKIKFSKGSKLKSIGQDAFEGCSGLKGVLFIPKSVTFVGGEAFYNCNKLKGVGFELGSKIKTIYPCAFGFYNKKGNLQFPKKNFKVYGEKKNKVARAYVKESNKIIKYKVSKKKYKKYKFSYKIKIIIQKTKK